MKLMFLNSIDEQTYGGMEEWIRLVAGGLSQRGHQITICGREKSEFLNRVKRSEICAAIIELKISGDFNPVTITRIKKEISRREINTLIVNFNKDIRLGGLAAKLSGEVSVVWSVGLDITKDSFAHKLITPRLIDGVIVPSHSLKTQITRHGYVAPEMVEVIHIGIPEIENNLTKSTAVEKMRKRFKLDKNSIICVTCGRLVEQKGHRYLVEAASKVVRVHPNVVFLFLGDGPLKSSIQENIARPGLQNHFILAGMVENVAEVLEGCDLMIHPAVEEPFGIAVLEGMRAGLPIIASNVGGLPEVVGNNGCAVLVAPKEADSLEKAINSILETPDTMLKMGEAAKLRWQECFRYELMIDKIEKYLEKLSAKVREYGNA